MKKLFAIFILVISINCFSQEQNPSLTFLQLVNGAWTPLTTLTINDVRLVDCSGGTYQGTIIYPDNTRNPSFVNLGNGQYGVGYFNHANFVTGQYFHYIKVQRKISGTWTDQFQFSPFYIGDFGEIINMKLNLSDTANNIRIWNPNVAWKSDTVNQLRTWGNQSFYGVKTFVSSISTSQIDGYTANLDITPRVFFTNTTYTPVSYGQALYTNSLTTKQYVDSIARRFLFGDTVNNMRLYGNQTAYGVKTFYNQIATPNITSLGGNNGWLEMPSRVLFSNTQYGTPICYGLPLYNNSLTTKSWVSSEISARILSFADSNYQESPNIVRLIPNGAEQSGQVYTTYVTALTYAKSIATSTKQITILVSGMGTSASTLEMGSILYNDTNRMAIDYVHFKALGNVILSGTDIPDGITVTFKGRDYKNIVYDGFIFILTPDQENALSFQNITFKDCSFINMGSYYNSVSFTSCRFLGTNYFSNFYNNVLQFVNCVGNQIFSNSEILRSGTNLIPAQTPTRQYIGANYIEDLGSQNGLYIPMLTIGSGQDEGLFAFYISTKKIVLTAMNRTIAANKSIFLDSLTNQLMYKKNNDTISYLVNDYINPTNLAGKIRLEESSLTMLYSVALPHAGKYRVEAFFNYEFPIDSISNWGTSDSICVSIANVEPPPYLWLRKIYNPINTMFGESGTGYVSIITDGTSLNYGFYAWCTKNAQTNGGHSLRDNYLYNIRINYELIN